MIKILATTSEQAAPSYQEKLAKVKQNFEKVCKALEPFCTGPSSTKGGLEGSYLLQNGALGKVKAQLKVLGFTLAKQSNDTTVYKDKEGAKASIRSSAGKVFLHIEVALPARSKSPGSSKPELPVYD